MKILKFRLKVKELRINLLTLAATSFFFLFPLDQMFVRICCMSLCLSACQFVGAQNSALLVTFDLYKA